MSLLNLIALFAAVGGILTFFTVRWQRHKNILTTFLQHFAGVWFIFSGFVKAVDPLGLALKQQEYFNEFKTTFAGVNWLAWLAPVMETMDKYAIGISIFVIVWEIMLGVMLIVGYRPRLSAWLFFILIAFFTILTGYTHFTGYVPRGGNFFTTNWEKVWSESNMRVTDCGCFGEFLKLKPTVSFYKDVFLTGVGIYFLFFHKKFHQFDGSRNFKTMATWTAGIVSALFCFQNTYLNEPIIDFRPFREGVNVREQKKAEEKAQSEVDVTFRYRNLTDNSISLVPMKQITSDYGDTTKWKMIDRTTTEPSVPHTKISEFRIEQPNGEDMTDSLLNEKGYYLLAISGKIYSVDDKIKTTVPDTVYRDTTIAGKAQRQLVSIGTKTLTTYKYGFDQAQAEFFRKQLNPLMEKSEKAGAKIAGLIAYQGTEKLEKFRHETQSAYPFFLGDDKLVKTIMRSNPGLLLMKDGQIIKKWHKNHLPSIDQLQALIVFKKEM